MPSANAKCRILKDREDEASQLNRLDISRSSELAAHSYALLLRLFVGAQLSVLLLSHSGSNDFQTTLLIPVQVRTYELATEN